MSPSLSAAARPRAKNTGFMARTGNVLYAERHESRQTRSCAARKEECKETWTCIHRQLTLSPFPEIIQEQGTMAP